MTEWKSAHTCPKNRRVMVVRERYELVSYQFREVQLEREIIANAIWDDAGNWITGRFGEGLTNIAHRWMVTYWAPMPELPPLEHMQTDVAAENGN